MFCPSCGKQSAPNSNFCSSCGAAAIAQPVAYQTNRIVRPRQPRMIAGVCSGFAIHFGWDANLVRILLCVFTILTSGVGILCYLAAWILLPEAQYALSAQAGFQTGVPSAAYQSDYQPVSNTYTSRGPNA